MARINNATLELIARDYRSVLNDDWRQLKKDEFWRFSGPIAQLLHLDRLRTEEYRPSFSIAVLTWPSKTIGGELLQFLSLRNERMSYVMHQKKLPELISVIKAEVFFNPFEPINVEGVYRFYSQKAPKKVHQAASLASLAAYLKNYDDYGKWLKLLRPLIEEYKEKYSELSLFFDKLEKTSKYEMQEILENQISLQKKIMKL
mgnify:CR=1 FL=1